MTSEVLLAPTWQNLNILPETYQSYLVEVIDYVSSRVGNGLEYFSNFELQGLLRALDLMKQPNLNSIAAKKNFKAFFGEHDRRRGTNLLKTFPEIEDFWQGLN